MIRLKMKNSNMILTEQPYYQAKLISMNILQVKKYCLLIKKIREQAKFTYSPLGKVFKEQTKEQAKAIKDLNTSDKRNKLKQIENIFPQNLLNDLVSDQFKKVLSYKTVLN